MNRYGKWFVRAAIAATTLLHLLPACGTDMRLQSVDEAERKSVVDELQRQRELRAEELRLIDAQIERAQRPANSGFGVPSRTDDPRARIVNGVKTVSFPAVGALLHSYIGADGTSRFTTWCTGTLIGSRTLITAAHCIADDLREDKYRVFFQNAGLFRVKALKYQDSLYRFPKADVAIVQLEAPVEGIRVQPMGDEAAETGMPGVIVGFGRTGGKSLIYGIKRTGFVKTSDCSCATAATCQEEGELICWKFDALITNPGMDSNTCNADSGGPLMFEKTQGEPLRLIGTTSGGTRADCLSRDESYDLAVFKYREWLSKTIGDNLGVSGRGPHVGQPGVVVQAAGGRFDEYTQRQSFNFSVGPGTARLVVALNGDDTLDGDNRFFLELRRPGNEGEPQCAQRDSAQFKACRIADPTAGDWRATVIAERGSGDFQLVSTSYPK